MVSGYGNEIKYTMSQISPDDEKLLGDFDCGIEEINEFLKYKKNESTDHVTYLYKEKETDRVLGFASISCSGIRYTVGTYVHTIPAIEVRYFAILNELHKLAYDETDEHFYMNDMMFANLLERCRDVSNNYIGADYIILYSVPKAVKFYKRNFFEDYREYMNGDKTLYLEGCTPMFLAL